MNSAKPLLAKDEPPGMSWFIVALGVITAMGPLSIDSYLPAFGDIAKSLSASYAGVQQSLTAFFIGLSFGQLFYGPISDRFGRIWPMRIGLVVFVFSSIGCAIAMNVEMLIVCRVLQALGASAGMVITRAMVRDRFSHNHAARVFSLLMLVMGVAPILAPLLGGYITVAFEWHWIFWFLAIMGVICLLTTLRLPDTHPPEKRLASINFLSVLKTYGMILRDKSFLGYSFSSGFGMAGVFAYIAGASFVVIDLYGVQKDHFGWFFGANALGMVIFSQINTRLLKYFSYKRVLAFGSFLMAFTSIALLIIGAVKAPLWMLAIGFFVYVSSIGIIMPNAGAGALENQAKNAGAAAALSGTLTFVFGSASTYIVSLMEDGTAMPMVLGMALCSVIGTLLYTFMVLKRRF